MSADPAAIKAAQEKLDAHLRDIIQWHFSPETGCPFWLDWARKNFDPRKEIRSFADMVKFPHSRVRTLVFWIFITFLDIPAWVMLIYWFGTQLLSGIGSIGSTQASQGGTAFFAHIGGFITGLILIKVLPTRQRQLRRPDPYSWQ